MHNSTTLRKLLLALAIIVVSTLACGDQPESTPPPKPSVFKGKIPAPTKPVSQAMKPAVQAARVQPLLPEKKPLLVSPPFYNPKGKLDPFQSVFVTIAQQATEADKKIRRKGLRLTPLQKVDLSQLKLVGIIVSPAGNKALVEDPAGKGYVVTKGTYIGTNLGRVKRILNDRVIVEERVEDYLSGEMKLQKTELRLQKKVGDV